MTTQQEVSSAKTPLDMESFTKHLNAILGIRVQKGLHIDPNLPLANDNLVTDWYALEDLSKLAKKARPGDLLEFSKSCTSSSVPLFNHWAIVAHVTSDGLITVTHYSTPPDSTSTKLIIRKDDLATVIDKRSVRINNYRHSSYELAENTNEVNRRINVFSVKSYDLQLSNCEIFAKFCRHKEHGSAQFKSGFHVASGLVGLCALWSFSPFVGLSLAAVCGASSIEVECGLSRKLINFFR